MTQSWLKDYAKYVVDFQILRTCNDVEDELALLGIIFKFPNGYGVRVEFESDDVFCLEADPAINVHVEMLDKNGMQYTEDTFKKARTKKFPNQHRVQFIFYSEVEKFLEKIKKL